MPTNQNINPAQSTPVVTGGTAPLPESPLTGSSNVGVAVTGTSAGHVGVLGRSVAPSANSATAALGQTISVASEQLDDGVYGTGKNGVHGLCVGNNPTDSGVLGENGGPGPGVTGKGSQNHGIHGINGAGSGTTPKNACGVMGESDTGYGIYGASKTSSGVFGTSGPGLFAGEFVGPVSITDYVVAGSIVVNGTAVIAGNFSATTAGFSGALDGTTAKFSGAVQANDVVLSGADCAEEFDVRNSENLEPGTVVVFDGSAALGQCTEAYDKRVAGVISGAGEYRPGVILDRRPSREGRAPVALAGKVFCKVDATYAPIEVGDLLTTSPTLGCAMKASDRLMAFGAVIGKALAPARDGRGLIPILVTLQ